MKQQLFECRGGDTHWVVLVAHLPPLLFTKFTARILHLLSGLPSEPYRVVEVLARWFVLLVPIVLVPLSSLLRAREGRV